MSQKYICTVCEYIYNPALGDSDGDIAPATAFEDIPDDWEFQIVVRVKRTLKS